MFPLYGRPTMSSAALERSQVTWDGIRSPNTIYEVWDFIGSHLHKVKDEIGKFVTEFYMNEERITYLVNIHEALKVTMVHDKTLNKVGSLLDLEQLLEVSPTTFVLPQMTQKASEFLVSYYDQIKITIAKLKEVRHMFQRDILRPLETYCTSYAKLGITDDNFYKALKSRTIKIRGILIHFDKIADSLGKKNEVPVDYFSDFSFSQELSLQFNCDAFPILRIVPDLFQKLDTVIDTGQDWLRSDKVYLDQIRKEIENTQLRIKDIECDSQLVKLKYDQLFSLVKQKRFTMDDSEEHKETLWRDISKLEAMKVKLDMVDSSSV